jgi:uncharacterized membrane protein
MDKDARGASTQKKVGAGGPEAARSGSVGRAIRRYLLTGLIVLLPAAITIYVLARLFFALDDILGRFVVKYVGHPLPGVGLVALILIIVGIGAVASNFIGKRLIGLGEDVVNRIPVMRWIYRTSKQLFSILLEERTNTFRRVVLVPYPYRGCYCIAFVTSEAPRTVGEAIGSDFVTVFLPTAPNPTSGLLLVVPRADVIPLDISVEEGLRLVISAGALANVPEKPAA